MTLSDATRLDIPAKSLAEDTLITMSRVTDQLTGSIHFEFGPHGTVFSARKPARLELSYSTLRDGTEANLDLYYFNEATQEWQLETSAIFKGRDKKAILEIDHFSRYYFRRR